MWQTACGEHFLVTLCGRAVPKILIAGELNVDLILQNYQAFPLPGREVLVDDMSLTLGSASAICAAGLAKLGDRVSFAGKVGCDLWGDFIVSTLRGLGVDLTYVLRDPDIKTGLTVSITSAKDRALVTYLGSIAALGPRDIQEGWFRGFRHLHVGSFFLQQRLRPGVKSLLRRARLAGLTTSVDPGCDPSSAWDADLVDALEQADFFFPNEMELKGITGKGNPADALRALRNGRTTTIAKMGEAGCMTLLDGRPTHLPAFRARTVDTTGAGDCFNAGFLHAWLSGRDILDSMRYGAACGALSTQALGGTAAQPGEDEVERFLAQGAEPAILEHEVQS